RGGGGAWRRRLHAHESEVNDGTNALAFVHQLESLIDLVQRQVVGNEGVQRDLAALRLFHIAGQFGTTLDAAERRTAPDPASDQLERTGADFRARRGHADDGGLPPALVA